MCDTIVGILLLRFVVVVVTLVSWCGKDEDVEEDLFRIDRVVFDGDFHVSPINHRVKSLVVVVVPLVVVVLWNVMVMVVVIPTHKIVVWYVHTSTL